jgi:hypothetical protein
VILCYSMCVIMLRFPDECASQGLANFSMQVGEWSTADSGLHICCTKHMLCLQ